MANTGGSPASALILSKTKGWVSWSSDLVLEITPVLSLMANRPFLSPDAMEYLTTERRFSFQIIYKITYKYMKIKFL